MNAKEFKRKRMSLGLTQAGLAEMLGVSANTVSRYETGLMDIPKVVELALETVAVEVDKRDALEDENEQSASVEG